MNILSESFSLKNKVKVWKWFFILGNLIIMNWNIFKKTYFLTGNSNISNISYDEWICRDLLTYSERTFDGIKLTIVYAEFIL